MLLTCVFARTVWAVVGEALGKTGWGPTSDDELGAWMCAKKGNGYLGNKDIHTMLLLVLWELWKHRNAIVFEGATPSMNHVLHRFAEEGWNWKQAGLLKGDLTIFFNRVERRVSTTS